MVEVIENKPLLRPLSTPSRDELFKKYHPLVKSIAKRLAGRLPPSIELDDLVNVGCIGLMSAIERFSPERQNSFKAFVRLRVQGEMIDHLRSLGWVPRAVRDQATQIAAVRDAMEQELGRAPSESEVAGAMGLEVSKYRRIRRSMARQHIMSLDELSMGDEGRDIHQVLKDFHTPDAVWNLERRRLVAQVSEALGELKERQKRVIMLYYVEEMTLREIGEILEVTEARVCQIRSDAIGKLQKRLKDADSPDLYWDEAPAL